MASISTENQGAMEG